jgi:Ca2+-transporting ATPase
MIMEKFNGPNEIMAALQTNPNTGIAGTKEDIAQRQKEFGANFFPPPEIKSLYELVMENFDDPINLVLLAAAAVSLIIGFIKEGFPEGMIEGSSICFALIIIIVVNSGNNYLSERRLAEQLKMCEKQMVSVYRNSEQTVSIDSAELVVGDIFVLEPGMNIPADSILLSG